MKRALFTGMVLTLLGAASCAPMRASRLYVSGTEALDRGDVTRAVDDLERAAVLVPEASEVQNHLGLAYAAAGRDDEALAAFGRAVALDCDNQAAQHNLSAAQHDLRSTESASDGSSTSASDRSSTSASDRSSTSASDRSSTSADDGPPR